MGIAWLRCQGPHDLWLSAVKPLIPHLHRLPWWLRWQRIHLQCRRPGFNFWVRKILWRRKWQPTPVFLPREFQGQRSLAGYSPWGHKELDTTEWLTHTSCCHGFHVKKERMEDSKGRGNSPSILSSQKKPVPPPLLLQITPIHCPPFLQHLQPSPHWPLLLS